MSSNNGFIKFVLHQQRMNNDWANKPMKEMVALCDPIWKVLSESEKSRFTRKLGGAYHEKGKDSYGRNLQEVELMNQKKREDPVYMINKIRDNYEHKAISETVFTVVHTNIFIKTDSGQYVPAEICFANFSLKDGVIEIYHDFPDPGVIPFGYKAECKITSDKTHKIPVDLTFSNPNYHSILAKLQAMLDEANKGLPECLIFTANTLREQTQGVLDQMYRTILAKKRFVGQNVDKESFPCEILDITTLLQTMGTTYSGSLLYESKSIDYEFLEKKFESGTFMWDRIACQLHEDDVRYCSKALVLNWIYSFCRDLCPKFSIPLVSGKHLPKIPEDNLDEDICSWSDDESFSFKQSIATVETIGDVECSSISVFESERRQLVNQRLQDIRKRRMEKGYVGSSYGPQKTEIRIQQPERMEKKLQCSGSKIDLNSTNLDLQDFQSLSFEDSDKRISSTGGKSYKGLLAMLREKTTLPRRHAESFDRNANCSDRSMLLDQSEADSSFNKLVSGKTGSILASESATSSTATEGALRLQRIQLIARDKANY